VGHFFQDNFDFTVVETAYEGADSASVLVGNERVKFDLIMTQNRRLVQEQEIAEFRIHFYCECKSYKTNATLKNKLKKFIENSLKVTPTLEGRFAGNIRFIFICNRPFGVDQENLNSIENIRSYLDDNYGLDDLQKLSQRIGIVILSQWFLDTVLNRG
jgi:hypothetical protein